MAKEPITLTNRDILKLHDGLTALSGVSNKKDEITRFDFSTDLVWNIAKNETLIERAKEAFVKAKKEIAAKYGVVENMKITDANAAQVASFIDAEEKLLEKTQDVSGLLKLSRVDLQKGGLNIPGVLKLLMPLLE